jgi:phosphate transport system protein
MGCHASEMVRLAVEATLNGDLDLSAHVVALDDEVDEMEREAIGKTVLTVMQESPVAADLRLLMATLGVVTEIEKVGDDAVKLARRATKLSGVFPGELKRSMMELGEEARKLFSHAMRLYCEYDPDLAREVVQGDKTIDLAYSTARSRVFEMIQKDPDHTKDLVRTIDAFHALEHVADHGVAIANRLRILYESSPLDSGGSES